MSRRVAVLLGVALLVAFATFAFVSFRTSLTPYVGFDEARSVERTVQVAGALEKGSTSFDEAASALHFTLVDPESGATLPVRYEGVKPANFEDAISIVAIGRWDAGSGEFTAGKLLVKCPSKYQGAEVKTYSS
ncbi:MAG TPA: cytochrome c maturation protein CcmE [Thermoanaerobaculia bacterium]|nr:cytochrome c maturation protein CcmE [Thermoanaerobaculia bacterium]